MTPERIPCVIAVDASDSPEAACELLNVLEADFSSCTDEKTKIAIHTIYCANGENPEEIVRRLAALADAWKEAGVRFSEIRVDAIRREDWAESWKIHFKPMIVSPRLAVRPPWEEIEAAPGRRTIVLNPGMSFGTGQHATTRFCLAAIDDFSASRPERLSFLDAGCGSGILAIAACKLGCGPVRAFDIDPDAIPIARENARENGVPDADLELAVSSLLDYPADMRFDFAAANILSGALIQGADRLLSLVKPGGRLILAGILSSEYPVVRACFEKRGCKELSSATEQEWTGGVFQTPA